MKRKLLLAILFLVFLSPFSFGQKTWDGGAGTTNWGDANNWNPNGVPAAGDNVTFDNNAGNITVIVNGVYSCNNLALTSNDNVTVQTTFAGNSLIINGSLTLNASNNKDNILDAAAGTITVAGAVTLGPAPGSERDAINVSTGTITFLSAVTLPNQSNLEITFTSTGTINFDGGFTDDGAGILATVPNCTVNFAGNYTNNNSAMVWDPASNAIFTSGTPTVSAGAAITFGNFQINSGITVTQGSDFTVAGNWVNNGGTFSGAGKTVTFSGTAKTIGGTGATAFGNITIADNASYTLADGQTNTCQNLTFSAGGNNSSLTHSANTILNPSQDVIINQPTAVSKEKLWSITSGSATITGKLRFVGTSNVTTQVAKVSVTGTLTVTDVVEWMANTAVATEVIQVTTGTINFTKTVTMNTGSGTIQATANGIMNFNDPTALAFGAGGGTAPVLSTISGSTVNFGGNVSATNNALTFATGSNQVFTASATITPTAAITFGNLQINATPTVTLAGNISVTGNWTNLGGTFNPSSFGVTFNGTGMQTITKAGGETFYILTANTTGPVSLANNVIVTNTLNMSAGNFDLNSNTLTLGNSAGATLTRSSGIMYDGTFKRWWPSGSAVSSTAAPLGGLFPVGSSTGYCPVEINSTANPTTAGYVFTTYIDALSLTDLSPAYDDAGTFITRISNTRFVLSTSLLAGGTYDIDVSMVNLGSAGVISDIRLAVFTGGTTASAVGTHAAATGAVSSPTAKRTGVSAADLTNDFRVSTINMAVTPIRQFYYSIASGNWADAVSVWSLSNGGPPCGCSPSADGYATITSNGTPVSVNASATIDFVDITPGGILNGTSDLTVTYDLTTSGSGVFTPTTGAWSVGRDVTLNGTGSSNTPSNGMSITGDLTLSGTTLTLGAGLTVSGDLTVNGTLAVATNTLTLNSNTTNISGTGTISGSGTMFFAGTSSPSYANIGGTGNRSGIIAVTGSFPSISVAGSVNELVNGTFGNTFGFNTNGSIVNAYYRFDFGAGNYKVVTEAKWYQHVSAAHGTWQWQGSNDGTSWTNIGGTFTLGSPATQTITTLSANTTGYRYYQMRGISGNSNNAAWQREIEFKIDAAASYKNILAGTNLTITPAVSLSSAATVTNYGTVTLQNNLTGVSSSTWTNAAGSVLNITGSLLATGTLNASASPNTVNYNSSGAQTIKEPASTYYNLACSNGNTKSLSSDITVTNLVTIQDATVLDETVDANDLKGAGGLTMTGTSQLIVRNGNIAATLPELSGTYTLSGGTVTITAATSGGTVVTVRGVSYNNLVLDGGIYHSCAPLTTVNNNFTIGGTVDITANGILTVGGSLAYSSTDADGWTLTNNVTAGSLTLSGGVIEDAGYIININGSGWTRDGGTFTTTGTVQFTGSGQSIDGAASTTFNNLIINNTNPTDNITINTAAYVNGALTMTKGLIVPVAAFTLNNGATATIGSTDSYVNGAMNYLMAFSGARALNFPIGKGTTWRPAVLTVTHSNVTSVTYTAEVFNTDPDGVAPCPCTIDGAAGIDRVSTVRYWQIDRTAVANFTSGTVKLEFDTDDGVADAPNLRVVKTNGAGTVWYDAGPASGGSASPTGNITSSSFTTFSRFTLGNKTGGGNPLPIDLLSFDAALNSGVVDLTWATASETNNDYFTIEKTKDGKEFEEVAIVKGAGSSNSLKEYAAIDKEPYPGISYYRLKQTDFDGRFTYSGMVAIDNTKRNEGEFIVFPNPSNGKNINLSFKGNESMEEILVILNDADGKQIYSKVLLTDDNGSFIIAVDMENRLPPGIYIVTGSSKNEIQSRKLVIK